MVCLGNMRDRYYEGREVCSGLVAMDPQHKEATFDMAAELLLGKTD